MIVTKSSFAGFASALALTGLSGCTTFNRSDADVAKVIEGTRQACKFLPTATSVLAVLSVPGAPAADKFVQISASRSVTARDLRRRSAES